MEHKKPPFLARWSLPAPRQLPSRPRGRLQRPARRVGLGRCPRAASGPEAPARGRVCPWPEAAAVVAMAKPRPRQHQPQAQGRHRWPPPPRRAAATSVQGMTSCPLPEPSIGPPTATAQGWPPPGLATPAAPAGRGPLGPPGSAEQQYASRHARTEGAVSSQAAAAALQDGRVTPASQMWTNAALEGAAVPSAVSTLRAVTGARAGRGTAHLQTVHSACPGEGPPGWPQAP
ncbi:epidermal growth factor-like protein 7 isoform X5 [Lemur catta]|uniref:epidermal growth factor-like protein 7 isoform X5 n=1 Tax=Lemur catta TaxID=9447 RepID=UPI001E2689ED|nr:epidermal growth factor-like protein 7 isoform X5 [Lemur catta]